MLKKKGDKDTDGASASKMSEQLNVLEKADENSCDVLTAQSGKKKYLGSVWLS